MGDPVSNQDLAVVTQGTAHVARTNGATDTCLDPATKKTQDFENKIPSTLLAKGKTVRTTINGHAIMIVGSEIGPPSVGASPPFVLGAKTMKPYLNVATTDKHSPDVKAEGKFIIRTNDGTFQNATNTTGWMDGSALTGDQVTQAEFQKLKCSMASVGGVAGKRVLGKRSFQATRSDYIEILAAETVDLTSTRWDATVVTPPPVIDPPCALVPTHTDWKAVRTGGGAPQRIVTASGKKFTVGIALTAADVTDLIDVSATATSKDEKKSEGKGVSTSGTVRGLETREKTSGVTASVDWAAILKFLVYWTSPCIIRVDAIACASTQTVDIRVFPKEKLTCSITFGDNTTETTKLSRNSKDDLRQKIWEKFGKIDQLSAFLKKIFRIADIELEVQLFVGFKVEFTMEYKHCEKGLLTRAGDWRDVNFVGLYWKLALSCDPLIAATLTHKIPLIPLAITFLTGGGGALVIKVLKRIEEWIGYKLQLEVSISLSVGFSFDFGVDQHEELIAATGTMNIKPAFSVALVIAASEAECSAGGSIEGTVTITAQAPDPGYFIKLGSSGNLAGKLTVSGKLKGRVLWVGPEYDIGGTKDFEIFSWDMWNSGPVNMVQLGTKKP